MKKPDAPLAAAAVKKNLDRADAAGIPPVVPGEATLLDKTPEVTA
jgi:hypothetical protein